MTLSFTITNKACDQAGILNLPHALPCGHLSIKPINLLDIDGIKWPQQKCLIRLEHLLHLGGLALSLLHRNKATHLHTLWSLPMMVIYDWQADRLLFDGLIQLKLWFYAGFNLWGEKTLGESIPLGLLGCSHWLDFTLIFSLFH